MGCLFVDNLAPVAHYLSSEVLAVLERTARSMMHGVLFEDGPLDLLNPSSIPVRLGPQGAGGAYRGSRSEKNYEREKMSARGTAPDLWRLMGRKVAWLADPRHARPKGVELPELLCFPFLRPVAEWPRDQYALVQQAMYVVRGRSGHRAARR